MLFRSAELRYAYARRIGGRIEAAQPSSPAERDDVEALTIEPATRHPIQLKAQEKKSGHARMQSAIVSEAKGGVVAFEGSPVDKAQIILTFFRERHLVDF